MDTYLKALVWAGRGLSILAFFLPFGVFLGLVGLMLTESMALLHRLVTHIEGFGDE